MSKPKKSRTINCKYEGEFNELLENVKFLKSEHSQNELQPGSIAFALATELENTLETLVNYKTDGCERDIQKTQAEKAAFKQAATPTYDSAGLFGFNSRRKSRSKSRKKSRSKSRKKSRRKSKRRKKSRSKSRRKSKRRKSKRRKSKRRKPHKSRKARKSRKSRKSRKW